MINMREELTSVTQVKERNVYLVKNALMSIPAGTRQMISRTTGLSITTCNSILNELCETNEVFLLGGDIVSSVGRPANTYAFNKDYQHICCVYLWWNFKTEGAFLHYAILDLVGNISEEDDIALTNITFDAIENLLLKLIAHHPRVNVISFGIEGYYKDSLNNVGRFQTLNGYDIINKLNQSTNCSIILENDMNAIAYGLYQSETYKITNHTSFLVISLFKEKGIGAGIILDGKILEGAQNFAGEVAYLPYPDGDIRTLVHPDTDSVINCAAYILQCLSAIINPSICVFTGELITPELIDPILELSKQKIPSENLPEVYYHKHYNKYYLNGLFKIAQNKILGADY